MESIVGFLNIYLISYLNTMCFMSLYVLRRVALCLKTNISM